MLIKEVFEEQEVHVPVQIFASDIDYRAIEKPKEMQEKQQLSLYLADNILETVGVRIFELGNNQWDNPQLRRLLEPVIPENKSFDDFIIEQEFPVIGKKKIALNARRLKREHKTIERIFLAMEEVT